MQTRLTKAVYRANPTVHLALQGLAFVTSPSSAEDLTSFLHQVEEAPHLNMFSHGPAGSMVCVLAVAAAWRGVPSHLPPSLPQMHLADELAQLRTMRHDF